VRDSSHKLTIRSLLQTPHSEIYFHGLLPYSFYVCVRREGASTERLCQASACFDKEPGVQINAKNHFAA